MLKFAWRSKIEDYAGWNRGQVEEIDMNTFIDFLEVDVRALELDVSFA